MSSPEAVDSGRFSGQKSNFSQTCTLLSQYLKERGSFGDLHLGTPNTTQTMNLLPMIEKSGPGTRPVTRFTHFGSNSTKEEEETTKKICSSVVTGGEAERSQMTIFYGGQVFVFNDFPAEKAEEIMVLASKGRTTNNPNVFSYNNLTLLPSKPAESSSTSVSITAGNQKPVNPITTSDLPIARRHSLARFLEKRKDRITSKGPYTMMGSNAMAVSSSKPEESNKAWLGLGGAQIPVKIEPQS